jgi:hypothetical protein
MDTKFQTSFIPKKPVISSGRVEHRARSIDFFSLLANMSIVIILLASAGVFGYKFYLKDKIETLDTQLAQMGQTFGTDLITELTRVDNHLKSAKKILDNHISIITLFEFLGAKTFQDVQFTNFHYELGPNGVTVQMNGKAKNYSTLVLQSDELVNSKYVQSVVFSNLDLDPSGKVIFSIELQLDKAGFLYTNNTNTLSFDGFPF